MVSEAPWKVYDQIEIDIFPTSICLTHNLHTQFKFFIFKSFGHEGQKNSPNNKKKKGEVKNTQNLQFDRKYQLLVPSKGNTGKSKLDNEGHNPILINDEESIDSKMSRANISDQESSNKLKVPKSARPEQTGLQREQFKDMYTQI